MLTYIYGKEVFPNEKVVSLADVENREIRWKNAREIMRKAMATTSDVNTVHLLFQALETMPQD